MGLKEVDISRDKIMTRFSKVAAEAFLQPIVALEKTLERFNV